MWGLKFWFKKYVIDLEQITFSTKYSNIQKIDKVVWIFK